MAEKRIVYNQSKRVKICRLFGFLTTIIIIYLKRYFETFVTNDFQVYSGGQLLYKIAFVSVNSNTTQLYYVEYDFVPSH